MEFFDISEGMSVNLDKVAAIERLPGVGTKVYINLDDLNKSVDSTVPFDVFKMVIAMKKKASGLSQNSERALDQLAKYQTVAVP